WEGGYQSHYGKHYTVEQARIFTLPDEPPPIAVAAAQPNAAELAGRLGDALITTSPDEELRGGFEEAGGNGKPCYGQLHVSVADSEEEGLQRALELWPNAAMGGPLGQELATTGHYEAVAELVREDDVAESVGSVADPEEDEDTVGGAGQEDDEDPGEEGDPDRRPPGSVARPVEQVVERLVAREAPLEPGPREEQPEDRQREQRAAPERVRHER